MYGIFLLWLISRINFALFSAAFQLSVYVCYAFLQHFQQFLLISRLSSHSPYEFTQIFYLSILKVILIFIHGGISFRQGLKLILQLMFSLLFMFD